MKNLKPKMFIISSLLLFTAQVSAQENSSPSSDTDEPTEVCNPWPSCFLGDSIVTEEAEKASYWALFWERLRNEMRDTVDSSPAPTQPEE